MALFEECGKVHFSFPPEDARDLGEKDNRKGVPEFDNTIKMKEVDGVN